MSEYFSNRPTNIYGDQVQQSNLAVGPAKTLTVKMLAMHVNTSRTGNNTPNYSYYIENGLLLPENNFQFSKVTTMYPRGFDYAYRDVYDGPTHKGLRLDSITSGVMSSSYEGSVGGGAVWPPGIDDRVRRRATNNLLKNAKDQKADMATTLAEGGKSIGTIVSGVGKITKAITELRRGNLAGAAQGLGIATSSRRQRRFNRTARRDQEKAIADSWLEMEYGWKPIIFSVYDAAVLAADTVAPIYRSSVTGKATEKFSSGKPTSYRDGAGTVTQTDLVRGHVEYRFKAVFEMTNESAHRAAMSGLTNPAVVAWELMPWSFVIDWFLPIGNWLSLLDATNGLTYKRGYVTWRRDASADREYQRKAPTHFRQTVQGWRHEEVGRGRLTGWPSPSLPSPRLPSTLSQLASGLALLSNLRK